MTIYGWLYRDIFDPVVASSNVMERNLLGCGDGQFELHAFLQKNVTYIVVVSPLYEKTTGNFSIFIRGQATVHFTQLEFSSIVYSSYSSKLNTSSAAYFLDVCSKKKQYYVALRITVSISDQYVFMSNSSFDLLGYVYKNSFDPANPSHDQIAQEPFFWRVAKFSLQSFLQANTSYVLLLTTLAEGVAGTISIISKGIADLGFTREGECDCFRLFILNRLTFFRFSLAVRCAVRLLFRADHQFLQVF